jgi:hypothetical protein
MKGVERMSNEQMSIDDFKRKRKSGFRNTKSTADVVNVKLDPDLTEPITKTCKLLNKSKSELVSDCVRRYLSDVKQNILQNKSKEELIDMIIQKGVI